MRVRLSLIAGLLIAIVAAGIFANTGNPASAKLQEATPEAAGTPTAGPVEVVTLVAWYSPDPSGEFLTIGPIRTNDALVAGAAEVTDRSLTGDVDFDDAGNDDLPRITLGESAFNAYPVNSDDIESTFRWVYTDEDSSLRPATLVLQIEAVKGPYKGYIGTATFVSRAFEAGGVLIIVLNPPAE